MNAACIYSLIYMLFFGLYFEVTNYRCTCKVKNAYKQKIPNMKLLLNVRVEAT